MHGFLSWLLTLTKVSVPLKTTTRDNEQSKAGKEGFGVQQQHARKKDSAVVKILPSTSGSLFTDLWASQVVQW